QLESSPFGLRWLGMTDPIWAVSPTPPEKAGTDGDAKNVAFCLKFRIDSSAAWSVVRSVAAKSWPPLFVAMQLSAVDVVASLSRPTTKTGTPWVRTLGSAAFAAARRPGALSGSSTPPRSFDGPKPVGPPPHGSA